VREGLTFKIVENLSPFEQKIFEAVTIQVSYPNKTVLLTSAYRSNGPVPNLTAAQQMDRFHLSFGELLSKLNSRRQTSFVFIDSNIDMLKLSTDDASQFLNNVLSNGFIQQVMKATRFQNQSKTVWIKFLPQVIVIQFLVEPLYLMLVTTSLLLPDQFFPLQKHQLKLQPLAVFLSII